MSPPLWKFSQWLNNRNLAWTKFLFIFLFFHTVHAHENPPNLTLLVKYYIKLNTNGKSPVSLTQGNNTISPVQPLSHVQLFTTPWTAAHQASLSIINSQSLPELMSIEVVMPPNHLILCHPLLLLPLIFSSIRVFSNESVLWIRWPKY